MCPDFHNIQPCEQIFGTVMYGNHTEQNHKKKLLIAWILRHCNAFLYYNGNYNRKNLWKPNFYIWGTKTHSYQLIFHPHIEEGQTKVVCFITKINLIKKNMRNLRLKIFAVTVELHCNGKNLKSQISQTFIDQFIFIFIKQTILVWPSSICGWNMSSYESFIAQHYFFWFLEIFPIVFPIVIQKCGATPQNSSNNLFFWRFWSIW